jgi:hypothetical protein
MVPFLNPMATIFWTPGIDSPCHGELVGGSPKNLGTGKCHASPGGMQGLAGSQHAGQAGGRGAPGGLGRRANRYEPPLQCSTCREEHMGSWMASFGLGMGPAAPAAAPSNPSGLHRACTASSWHTALGITFQPGGVSWQTRVCPGSPRPVEHEHPVGPPKLDRNKPPRPPGIRLGGKGLRVHLKDSKTTCAWVSHSLA